MQVTLNFTKAHLDPFEATAQRDMSPELIRPVKIHEGQRDSSTMHHSADRMMESPAKYESLAANCCTQFDHQSYLEQFAEEQRIATLTASMAQEDD